MFSVHIGMPVGCFLDLHMLFVHKGIPAGCFIALHMLFVHRGIPAFIVRVTLCEKKRKANLHKNLDSSGDIVLCYYGEWK